MENTNIEQQVPKELINILPIEKKKNYYSLREVSKWQSDLGGVGSSITLPSLQRGFVWKPSQIEDLWDSIFRGYPIGSILLTIDKNSNCNLLDGQQRCTSIALGHFNPFKENLSDFLSLKEYKPSIWVDIAPKQKMNGHKFVFRCLTRSHPWGYQLKDNTKTLSMAERKKAISFYKSEKQNVESYTDFKSESISPWDAYYPVPLSFILDINADNEDVFNAELSDKIKTLKVKTQYSQNNFVNYSDVINTESLNQIYCGYKIYKEMSIPEILIDADVLKNEEETLNKEDDDPTLFVRLNSAGTRISGEELNYSIYKAYFPKVKNLVEDIGASYIVPSKIISLFSKLTVSQQSEYSKFQKEFTTQSFKKKISEDLKFRELLQLNIENQKDLVPQAISIIGNSDPSFPKILTKQIIVANFDLFYVLLTYIERKGFKTISEIERKEIASCYVYILWFNKDHKKIANELFNILIVKCLSWKEVLIELINGNKILPIITPSLLRKNMEKIIIHDKVNFDNLRTIKDGNLLCDEIKEELSNSSDENLLYENWKNFIGKLYWNKSLLLYAQKQYLNDKFKEFNQFENIDDTNRPWDWDHIYPNSWVMHKENINPLVRNWVNSIGNFRALSYDDNRSENNYIAPKARFENDERKEESFVGDEIIYWNQIDSNYKRIKSDEIEKTKIFLNAIIHRMINIYQNWHEKYFM